MVGWNRNKGVTRPVNHADYAWNYGWPDLYRSDLALEAPKPERLKKTLRRPFIEHIEPEEEKAESLCMDEERRPLKWYTWTYLVGCKVFDGLCVWQDDHEEIDCAQCIKSTFEAFIKGCPHREHYTDPYGKIRCAACKDELGQIEPSDVLEEDDTPEEDDPREPDSTTVLSADFKPYATWTLENRVNQSPREHQGESTP